MYSKCWRPPLFNALWANWSGHASDPERWILDNIDLNTDRYCSYGAGYRNALKLYGERILLVQFEKICQSPELEFQEIFDFLGIKFKKKYLSFSSKHFVYGNTVSEENIYPYKGFYLCRPVQRYLKKTEEYSDWHFN